MKLDDPEISARRLDKAVQKERYYLLPVETRNNDDEEELKMMKEFIITALYVGHSTKKRITKKMFMTRYSNLADRLWTPRDHSGSIECTVS